MNSEIWSLSASELCREYEKGSLSPVEVMDNTLSRLDALNKKINAFVMIDYEKAKLDAKESESRWHKKAPLSIIDGIPTSIKDLILTKNWPTLRGSKAIDKNTNWTEDAPVVERLRESGAILFGKTTTPEFGHRGTTQSPLTGVTRNPWNIKLTSGGSSGGSSSAVSSDLGPFSIGTDGGGSVRIPCSFTGIFGIKPTFGRVAAWPLSPFGTVANIGPMTRTVEDGAMLMQIIAQPDVRDWHSLVIENANYVHSSKNSIKGLRIGYSKDWGMSQFLGSNRVEPDIDQTIYDVVLKLEDMGAIIEEINIEWPRDPKATFEILWKTGAANLSRQFNQDQKESLDSVFFNFCEEGKKYNLFQFMDAEANRALNGSYINKFFSNNIDVIVGPTMPITAFEAENLCPDGWGEDIFGWTPFTYPFNLTKNPASTMNCGFDSDGLPIGIQVVAPTNMDALCFTVSYNLEKKLGLKSKRPKI